MSKKAPTSTHLFEWPELDQHLWQVATQKGNFLERDGKAAHWSAATRLQVQKGYGKWIFHLTAEGGLTAKGQETPIERVDEDQLRSYLECLKAQGLASQTIASRIIDLTEAIRVMQPEANITILRQLSATMQQRATPSRKKHARIKPPQEIWQACLKYMEQAMRDNLAPNINQASRFRDALSLGLLAQRPLRRRNMSGLVIGEHLTLDNDVWHCHIIGDQTKDGATISFTLPDDGRFFTVFEHYLLVCRQHLLRKPAINAQNISELTGPLWISTRGKAMTSHAFYYGITRISDELLGAPLNPHILLDCAASALSSDAPEYILVASRILGHSDLATTLGHYEQSSMLAAGTNLASTMEALQQHALASAAPLTEDNALPFLDIEEGLA
jgi:site-specific recombinase XerD